MEDVRFLTAGDTALVVEFGAEIDRGLSNRVLSLSERVRQAKIPGVTETVPTFRSLAVHYDPLVPAAVPVATGKIGLEYKRRFWEEDEQIFGGITNTNMDLSTIWYPSYGYLGDRGLVVGYYNFGANAVSYGDAPLPETKPITWAPGASR